MSHFVRHRGSLTSFVPTLTSFEGTLPSVEDFVRPSVSLRSSSVCFSFDVTSILRSSSSLLRSKLKFSSGTVVVQ